MGKSKKISFTRSRKNVNDKFFDLLNKHTKIVYKIKKVKKKNKHGKYYTRKVKHVSRIGKTVLAKSLNIKVSTLNNFIKFGVPPRSGKKIDKFWRAGKFEKTKVQTIEYRRDTFTRSNFFKYRKIRKTKKHEQYYFRCGIYLECTSNKNKKSTYIINNLPIPSRPPAIQTNSYKEGFEAVYDEIKIVLQSYPSIKLWRINYFDVHIINIDSGKFMKGKLSNQNYGKGHIKDNTKKQKFTKSREAALRKKYAS